MAEEIRRTISIKIDDVDEEKGILYIRVEEGGNWLFTIPIRLSELEKVEDKKRYVKEKVLEKLKSYVSPKPLPSKEEVKEKYKELEMEIEVT